jgi:renal tumor antigen
MRKYRLISKKGEGTFSEVLKAQSLKTGRCVNAALYSIDRLRKTAMLSGLVDDFALAAIVTPGNRRYVAVKAMKQHFSTVDKVSTRAASARHRAGLVWSDRVVVPAVLRPKRSAQVNNLREIQALRRLSPHPNIVSLLEVLYDRPSGRLALVFELMNMNLYDLIRGRDHYLDNSLIRIYLFQ